MWVLSILLSDRAATTIPPTNATARTTARPILAVRVLITVLLQRTPALARLAGPRRGQGDRPAPGSARLSRPRRVPRGPAGARGGPPPRGGGGGGAAGGGGGPGVPANLRGAAGVGAPPPTPP